MCLMCMYVYRQESEEPFSWRAWHSVSAARHMLLQVTPPPLPPPPSLSLSVLCVCVCVCVCVRARARTYIHIFSACGCVSGFWRMLLYKRYLLYYFTEWLLAYAAAEVYT